MLHLGTATTDRATAAESTGTLWLSAKALRRLAKRSSNAFISFITQLRSKPTQEASQPSAGPGRAKAQRTSKLIGVKTSHIAECNERTVIGLHASQSVAQVDITRVGSWIAAGRGVITSDLDLEHSTTAPATRDLTSLVNGDRDEPRPQAFGLAQRGELAPGDWPGRLNSLFGELGVASGDHEADTAHIRVMGIHDPSEGNLVAVRGESNQPRRGVARGFSHGRHRQIDARTARTDSLDDSRFDLLLSN
jgi:hypothetical protein